MGQQLKAIMSRINMFHVPVYLIHGNHESVEEIEAIIKLYPNITFLHGKIQEFNGWWFGAYGTSGLRDHYEDFEQWAKEHDKDIMNAAKTNKLIWMDHSPPYNNKTDMLAEDWHVGSQTLRAFIEKYQPLYVFCGHLHETFGYEDMIGETIVINPGPRGKIIELE